MHLINTKFYFQEQSEIPPKIQINLGKSFGPLHVHPAAPTMEGHPEIFKFILTKIVKFQMVLRDFIRMFHVMKSLHSGQCFNYTFFPKVVETQCLLICIWLMMI